MRREIVDYIENYILPRYEGFDKAHSLDHVLGVIARGQELAERFGADREMVYVACAYHDLGAGIDREHHHTISADILHNDPKLRKWFSEEQISVMADAAEDHRASASRPPRTLYGRITAEADHNIDPEVIMTRCIQYGLDSYPGLSREEQYVRFKKHLQEKYGEGGYLKLWLDGTVSARNLSLLRETIKDETSLRNAFDRLFALLKG